MPQYVAIIYTMNYLDDHNFYDIGRESQIPHDTLKVNKFLHFNTFANLTGICLEDLQQLNPSIQRNAVPETSKTYSIKIPLIAKDNLMASRAAILDSASKVGKKEMIVLAKNTEGSTYGRDRVIYRVKSGDVIGGIALRYNVRVNDIRTWNNLNSNTIRVGQRLNIWLRQPSDKDLLIASTAPVKSIPVLPIPGSKTYEVQNGDTLWDISRKFEGLTIEKIKQLNNLSNSKIQPGQKLIIAL